jgi:polyribonucleotide nucleotidyltransferase
MASVCAGSLSLHDAGVRLGSGPAAGVAIGLLENKEKEGGSGKSRKEDHMILTDLLGLEVFFLNFV